MEWLQSVAASAVTSALFVAISTAIVSHLFSLRLAKQKAEFDAVQVKQKAEFDAALMRQKAELDAEQQRAGEHLRASLAKKTTEHQIRFQKLHENMATVLADLFTKLERSFYFVNIYSSDVGYAGDPPKEEQHRAAFDRVRELQSLTRQSSLFLPDPLLTAVEDYLVTARAINRSLRTIAEYEKKQVACPINQDTVDEDVAKLGAKYTAIRTQLQRILGIEQDNAA